MNIKALAKQIKTNQIEVNRVIFEFDGEQWVFESPMVVEANMMGNRVFQIFGNYKVEKNIDDEDIKLIMEKTNCDRETAEKYLKKYGDIAEAILHIMEDKN